MAIALAVSAVVTGLLARKQIKESYGAQSGDQYALIGMICGILALVLFIASLVIGGIAVLIFNALGVNTTGA